MRTFLSFPSTLRAIILLLALISCAHAQSTSDYQNYIQQFEGYRNKPYTLNGISHFGIGHAFKPNEQIKAIYTDEEIQRIFDADCAIAIADARACFASFDKQTEEIKLLLVDMAYNLGRTKLRKFVMFRKAIDANDYQMAGIHLFHSRWYDQVGYRAQHHFNILVFNNL